MSNIRCLSLPERHDYPAAGSHLSLLLSSKEVDDIISRLQKTDVTFFRATEILRDAKLKILGADNQHVASDPKKIRKGEALSPIIPVRGNLSISVRLTIAYGYHRACTIYLDDEDIEVACPTVGLLATQTVSDLERSIDLGHNELILVAFSYPPAQS
jgi:hypothetical protein